MFFALWPCIFLFPSVFDGFSFCFDLVGKNGWCRYLTLPLLLPPSFLTVFICADNSGQNMFQCVYHERVALTLFCVRFCSDWFFSFVSFIVVHNLFFSSLFHLLFISLHWSLYLFISIFISLCLSAVRCAVCVDFCFVDRLHNTINLGQTWLKPD